MFRKRFAAFVVFLLITAFVPLVFAGEDASGPRVLFNSDGGILDARPPITLETVCRPVSELEDTSVDVFIHCVNYGADIYYFRGRAAQWRGDRSVEVDWSKYQAKIANSGRNVTENLRLLEAAGVDPVKEIEKRTHRLGKQFWLSLRMNDAHEEDPQRFGFSISEFKKKHPELLLGKDFFKGSHAEKNGWSSFWNYAKQGTREHILAVLTEMAENYEVDGLELDFMRSWICFPPGKEAEGMPLLTDFVREVRAMTERVGKQKGRRIVLAVRVDPTLDRCRRMGRDVPTWIKEGIVDWVIPMDSHYLDMTPDLSAFVDLAKGTKVKIAGGVDNIVLGYDGKGMRRCPSLAQLYAAAAGIRQQGADAVYFFNFDPHRRRGRHGDYTDEEMEFLKNVGDPQSYAEADKAYFVTLDCRRRTGEEGGNMQLPAKIKAEETKTFSFTVGDDIDAARKAGALAACRLRIELPEYETLKDNIEIKFNGEILRHGDWQVEGKTLTYDFPPARRGVNQLSIRLDGDAAKEHGSVVVNKIELLVDYR